jgi:hypothetical protein
MAKIDLKKTLKHLYNPSAAVVSVVDVPPMNFLLADGSGNPNTSPDYAGVVEALYAAAFALKFKIKKGKAGVDYAVMPLEGLWWAEEMSQFSVKNKEAWKWTMMIVQPEPVTSEMFVETISEVEKKKGLPALSRVRFESFHEGQAVQIMHIGPYSKEEPTVAKLHAFIRQSGYKLRGKHHEIYLKDPRKSAPDKLHTVVRQPFKD